MVYYNTVRIMRKRQGLSRKELARKAKLAIRTLYHVERGGASRRDTKRKILKGLGLGMDSIDEIFPEEEAETIYVPTSSLSHA